MKKIFTLLLVILGCVGQAMADNYIPVYIKMGSAWQTDNPRIAIYTWYTDGSGDSNQSWWSCTELSEGYWRGMFNATNCNRMIIARMNPNNSTNSFDSGTCYNQSGNLNAPTLGTSFYYIGDEWSHNNPTATSIEESGASYHTIYIRNKDTNDIPNLYTWFVWDSVDWPFNGVSNGTAMTSTTIEGETWYVYKTIETIFKCKILKSDGSSITDDISLNLSDDVYYNYHPSDATQSNRAKKLEKINKTNTSGYCTYVNTNALTISDGAKAYYAVERTSPSNGCATAKLHMNPQANTPMLIKGSASHTYYFEIDAGGGTPISGGDINVFQPGTSDTEEYGLASTDGEGHYNYILNGDTFYAPNGKSVAVGKAYLQLGAAALARPLIFSEDDDTGIDAIMNTSEKSNAYYNLSGQRIANPTKGLYISNGKKVVIR